MVRPSRPASSLLLALLCAAAPALAQPASEDATGSKPAAPPEPPGTMVLPVAAAEPLGAALAALKPELSYEAANIEKTTVALELCAAEGDCFAATLSHRTLACAGFVAGPFCVATQRALTTAQRAAFERAFGGLDPNALWKKLEYKAAAAPGAGGPVGAAAAAGAPMTVSVSVYAVAPLLVLVPLALGVWLGLALRRRRGRRFASRLAGGLLVGLPVSLLVVVGLWSVAVGFWDVLLVGLCLGLGLFAGAHEAALRIRPLPFAASVLGTVVALELVSRVLLPAPPAFPVPEQARLFLRMDESASGWLKGAEWREVACDALFKPGEAEKIFELPPLDVRAERRLVHLGDSLVFGLGVDAEERFTSLLELRDDGSEHVNLGMPSTSIDVQWAVARQLVEELKPDAVVYYLYPGNDLLEIDMPMPCCGAGPIMRYEGGRAEPACESRTPGSLRSVRLGWLFSESPPPFPLRVATGLSSFASHASAGFVALSTALGKPAGVTESVAWEHWRAVFATMREDLGRQGVPLVAVLLPDRAALELGGALGVRHKRLRSAAGAAFEALGVPWLDGWERFEPLVAKGGGESLFTGFGNRDPHFNVEGHVTMAEWLEQSLPASIAEARRQQLEGEGAAPAAPGAAAGVDGAP
jgi:hypothetical protein